MDPANAQCNSFLDGDGVCRDAIRVPVTTIDAFVAEHGLSRVDFIKMSVQGYDMHLLREAKKTISYFAPKLSILYCNAHFVPYSMEDVKQLIKKFNPKYRVIFRGKKLFAAVPDL